MRVVVIVVPSDTACNQSQEYKIKNARLIIADVLALRIFQRNATGFEMVLMHAWLQKIVACTMRATMLVYGSSKRR